MDPRRRFFLRGDFRAAADRDTVPAAPRPPWSLAPDARFTAQCTRCGDCVRACPRGLIAPGDGGFPVLSFARQGCDACGACRSACGTGAIAPLGEAGEPFRWRVQVAAHCLAQQRVECRLCADACDTGALRFRPALGGVWQLQIEPAVCSGCGDCVAPCPVAAITMAEPARSP